MSIETELAAIRESAAIFPLDDRAFLRITGPDATRWLNGMVTNSIQSLAPGHGNYNFLLNAQGRIQGDCTIYRDLTTETEYLLETARSQVAAVQQLLDRFIIMDDVELLPIMDDQHGLLLLGPAVADRLTSLSLPAMTPHTLARASYSEQPVLLLAAHAPYSVELWAAPETIAALRIALEASTTQPISPEAMEAHRVLSAIPRYGQDIRNTETAKDLPQETAQTHALHFSKGCYLGQEIVERIHSRGQVHRTFTTFQLTGSLPALPAALTVDCKPVGEVTSAIAIGDKIHALGYLRREHLKNTLQYDGGTASTTGN